MRSTIYWLLCVIVTVAAVPASAGTIAAWDFLNDAQPVADGRNPNTLAAGVSTAQGLTRGPGLVAASLVRAYSSTSWVVANKDDAIAGGKFLTFELAAIAGKVATYQTLDYKVRRASAGANEFIWQYRIGAGPFVDIESATTYTGTETNGVFFQDDLSGIAALQNVSDPTTFRFVAWGGAAADGSLAFGRNGSSVVGDTLILSGSVVPEPASLVLVICCSMWCSGNRRRKGNGPS